MHRFLNHRWTRRDKTIAKWGVSHLLIAVLGGSALAVWLIMTQAGDDHSRMNELRQQAAQTVENPTSVPPETKKIGGAFTLTDQNGRLVTDENFAGKYLLVYFGYTTCPDICPSGLQNMSIALDALHGDADKIQPLFITVDPERDTPERLKQYDSTYSSRILGLTGTQQQIASVANAYQVYYKKGDGDQDYEVEHSELIYLIDPKGTLVTTFDGRADPKIIASACEKALSDSRGKP